MASFFCKQLAGITTSAPHTVVTRFIGDVVHQCSRHCTSGRKQASRPRVCTLSQTGSGEDIADPATSRQPQAGTRLLSHFGTWLQPDNLAARLAGLCQPSPKA
eukprot:1157724-Pelagomonas_calceolata.AAC.8